MSTTPTTKKITGEQLIETVRAVAHEHPNFVYNSHEVPGKACFYRNEITGEPDCIIGRALDALGVLPEEMGLNNTVSVLILLGTLSDSGLVEEISQSQMNWLCRVQSYQDSGDTWGDAVRKADKWVVFQ